jgi:putative aldouronate transport system substrate-binding protein
MKLKIGSPLTDSYYDDLAAFEESAKRSKSFGYTFDASAFSAEAGAIANVVAEYLPMLNAGLAPDVEGQLSEFQTALREAGIEDVIAANQEQLDEYIGN